MSSTSTLRWGGQSMVAPLRRVIVKDPRLAWRDTADQWEPLGYRRAPDLAQAAEEHDALVACLRAGGAEVLTLPADDRTDLDSVYTHDPALVTDAGVVLFRMGKASRRAEADALDDALAEWDVPILGRVEGDAVAEGGDMVWLDERTLAVGRTFRTNTAAVGQLRDLLGPHGVEVEVFDLPCWQGRSAVLHLMSVISMLDVDLAIVHRPLLPVALLDRLAELGIETVDADPGEWDHQGANVLALGARQVLTIAGNERTEAELRRVGCTVTTFPAEELAVCGDGGPTCLTRPLLRQE